MLSPKSEMVQANCNKCSDEPILCDCAGGSKESSILGPIMHSLKQGEQLLVKKVSGLEKLLKNEARNVFDLRESSDDSHGLLKEGFTMPSDSNVGMRTEFEKILSMYDQSYQCLIEDLVKRQSGNGNVASETVYAEWDRLGKLEGKLVELVGAMSSSKSSSNQIDQSLQTELAAKRQHLMNMSDTLIPNAQPFPTSGSSTVGASGMPSLPSSSSAPSAGMPNPYASVSLSAKAESTGLYARMFYTRLIFWVILAVMLAIAILHAYSSSGNSMVSNTLAVIISLVILYYGIRYIYNRWFY